MQSNKVMQGLIKSQEGANVNLICNSVSEKNGKEHRASKKERTPSFHPQRRSSEEEIKNNFFEKGTAQKLLPHRNGNRLSMPMGTLSQSDVSFNDSRESTYSDVQKL